MEDQLEVIVSLAERQLELEQSIIDQEEALKETKDQLRQVSERDLPDAMDEAGVEEFTLKDGRKVTVKVDYYASIPKAHQPAAFNWLRERGHDGIIKRNITAKFGKGQDSLAQRIATLIRENAEGIPVDDKQSVHFQTLRAFVREQMEQGVEIPEDIFGIHVRNVAKVK